MASIVLKNKSLFIPGRGEGGKGGRFLDSGVITWGGGVFGILEGSHGGGGRGTENSLLMKFHSEGES